MENFLSLVHVDFTFVSVLFRRPNILTVCQKINPKLFIVVFDHSRSSKSTSLWCMESQMFRHWCGQHRSHPTQRKNVVCLTGVWHLKPRYCTVCIEAIPCIDYYCVLISNQSGGFFCAVFKTGPHIRGKYEFRSMKVWQCTIFGRFLPTESAYRFSHIIVWDRNQHSLQLCLVSLPFLISSHFFSHASGISYDFIHPSA